MNTLVAHFFVVTKSHGKGTVGLYSVKIFDSKVEMVKINSRGDSNVPTGSVFDGRTFDIDIDMKINVGDTRTSKTVAFFDDLHDAMECFVSSDLRSLDCRWLLKTRAFIADHLERTPGFRCSKKNY